MARTLDRFQGRREEDSLLLTGSTSLPSASGEFTYLTSSVSGSGFFFNENGEIKSLGIQSPINPTTGSLLCYDGSSWTNLSAGPSGYSLVSNGPDSIPSWSLVSSSYPLIINYISSSFTGSNSFGSNSENTHTFTGSVILKNGATGSLLGTASYAINADLLDGLNSSEYAKINSINIFNADQIISGSLSVTSGLTGSLFGTSSYSLNSNLLDGLDSEAFARKSTISVALDGIVSGSSSTLIGTFYVIDSVTYSTNSFIYFGGSQGSENATIVIKSFDSPFSIYSNSKNSTLSITYLTSSLSLNSGLYNIYLYSSGSGTAIAKNLFLSN